MADTGSRLFPSGSFMQLFFDEKDLAEVTFEIENSKGITHVIPNMVVIEHIAQTGREERRNVEGILRRLDFQNGNINHFLKHLAKGLAENC